MRACVDRPDHIKTLTLITNYTTICTICYNNIIDVLPTLYTVFTYIHSKQEGPPIILMSEGVQEVHENKVSRHRQSHNLYSSRNLQDLLGEYGKCIKRWK